MGPVLITGKCVFVQWFKFTIRPWIAVPVGISIARGHGMSVTITGRDNQLTAGMVGVRRNFRNAWFGVKNGHFRVRFIL